MPIKTQISDSDLQAIISKLHKYFSEEPIISSIKDGEISQAYQIAFNNSHQEFILRVNNQNGLGFFKDAYAYNTFSREGIQIPKIICNGQNQQYYYSLSEKCSGKLLDKISAVEGRIVEQDVFEQLLRIYAIKPMGSGYGVWNENLEANFKSLHDYVVSDLAVDNEALKHESFVQSELHEQLRQKAFALEKYLVPDRYLIHCDVGFNNACCENEKVTGIFDWAESSYKDFVFDIAWLMFWNSNALNSGIEFKKYYDNQSAINRVDLNFSNYEERLEYALLVIGHSSLCYFAKAEQVDSYFDTINIIHALKLI